MTESTSASARTRVLVLYGGQSTEHSVSCISAGAIMDNLDRERFEIIPVGITASGAWVPGTSDPAALRTTAEGVMPTVADSEEQWLPLLGTPGRLFVATGPKAGSIAADIDVVFPVLHGPFGEDGTIQGLCELWQVPFVGCGVLASAAAMDKAMTKRLVEGIVPTAPQVVLHRATSDAELPSLSAEERERLGLPLFVKPARGGSSIGVSKVDTWEQLDEALRIAFDLDDVVLVESMIVGAEVECGVLERADGSLLASVPAELTGTDAGEEGFYGFDAKYVADQVSARIPADLSEEYQAEIQELARRTFRALGCSGLARVDFFATADGPVLNEVNTLPGFTPISMYPQMLGASGVDYTELLTTLIEGHRPAAR